MKKGKLANFLATSIGRWKISRNKEDITQRDVETLKNRATDFLANDKGWFLVSDKLRKVLESLNTEIQFLPVKIMERKSKKELPNYYIANILRVVDALCLEKSVYFEVYIEKLGTIYNVVKYGIFAEKTENSDVFKLANRQEIPIFVSENFKNKVEKEEITGIYFLEIKVFEKE